MYDCVYIHHEKIEKTCNTLLQFLKYNSDMVDSVLVICTGISPEDEHLLKCIYPLKIVTPLQFNDIKNNFTRTLNITSHIDNIENKHVGISYYVYYTQFLTEGLNYFNRFAEQVDLDIDLHIQTHGDVEMNYIKKKCGQVLTTDIDVFFDKVENRGRDVLPFFNFIKSEKYKNYDYICKVHTKKTSYLDLNWRSNYFKQLFLDQPPKCFSDLDANKPLKLEGNYIIYEKYNSRNINYKTMLNVLNKLNIQMIPNQKFKFDAGTMFWCNKKYCDKLNQLISDEVISMFEPEPLATDGTVAHAWERIFGQIT